jgi:predicted porin
LEFGNLLEQLGSAFDDSNVDLRDQSIFEINSWASRLGVKGSEDLGDGLKAIYQIEGQVNFADQTNEFGTATALLTGRNTFVGLAGGFGTVLLGRHDTPLKMSTAKLDYFADTSADYNSVYSAGFTDRRADGTLAYVSPNLSGLTLAAALVPGENQDANGLADAYSVAAMYENGGIYLAGAYEAADGKVDALDSTRVDVMGAGNTTLTDLLGDLNQWRVGGGYDAGGWKVAAVYENEQVDDTAGATIYDADKWNISGAITLGMGEIKATYFDQSEDLSNIDVYGATLGYDYNFSKRTQTYVQYTYSTTDVNTAGVDDLNYSVVSVGLNHSF